jgi:carbonic anhydrase
MKFNNKIIKILFCYLFFNLIILTDIYYSIKTYTKSKFHSERESSLMETINNFFANKKNNENIFYHRDIPIQKTNNNYNNYKPIFIPKQNTINEENNDFYNYKFKESKNTIQSRNEEKNEGLYDTSATQKIEKPKKKLYDTAPKSKKKGHFQFRNTTFSNYWRNNIKKKIKKTTNMLIEDWFMISSPNFKSEFFPEIKINEKEISKIITDENNFRINNAFSLLSGKNKPMTNKYFWFRLSGLNLYYSVSPCDQNILGSISKENMNPPSEINKENDNGKNIYCFTINDNLLQIWKICNNNEDLIKLTICTINKVLKIKSSFCKKQKYKNIPKNIAIQPMIIIPKPSRNCNEGWNYLKKGEDWECDCKEGREQSPIDLPNLDEAIDSPVTPLFHFSKVDPHFENNIDQILNENEGIKIKILENSLRILNQDMGRIITVDGAVYKAKEIVIHSPSEHTIKGKKYDAEMQVLFFGQSKGDISKQVILSFLFEGTPGEYNKFFDSIDYFNFPNAFNNEKIIKNKIFIPDVFCNMDDEDTNSMKKFSFYTYQGSLTFPPCTENTIMYVTSKPIPLSTTTITLIQESVRIPDKEVNDKIYLTDSNIENDRKIQNSNGRPVFHYDHQKYCGPDPIKKKKEIGHFEKVKLLKQSIFFVDNNKPSGFPESFVIGMDEAYGQKIN